MAPMNPRLLRPTPGGFDPRRIAGLDLWLDFSDQSTLTLSGSSISEIRDKSGKGWALTQGTGANQPTFTAGAINGRGAAVFNGSSTRLTVASYTALGNVSLFILCYRNWTSVSGRAMLSSNYSSTSGISLNAPTASTSPDFSSGDAVLLGNGFGTGRSPVSTGPITNVSLSNGQPVVISGKLSTGESRLFFNGVNVGTRTSRTGAPNIASATLHIGCEFVTSAGNFWDGGIAQVLIYNAALPVAEIKQVERWLGGLYGITVAA